jgi:hypothetical protein
MLWKGEFVSIDAGHFHPRGTDPITFPPGIPFHRLESPEATWPRKAKANHLFPHDHGYQFLGYHLDARRRPTFRYRYEGILVEDFFEDVLDAQSKAYFRRTLTFTRPSGSPALTDSTAKSAAQPFEFRAAVGQRITSSSARSFSADSLRLRITSDHSGRVRGGASDEVLILLNPTAGRSTLTLEYQW